MKAFEDWYKENLYDRTETKKAWRAALEWVLGQCDTDWDEYDRSTGFFILDDDIIKGELEDD